MSGRSSIRFRTSAAHEPPGKAVTENSEDWPCRQVLGDAGGGGGGGATGSVSGCWDCDFGRVVMREEWARVQRRGMRIMFFIFFAFAFPRLGNEEGLTI